MALEVPAGLTLYFCRHGETEANVDKRFQGHSIDTPLTENGVAQAQAIGGLLRGLNPNDLEWVSSPLERAQATIELIRDAMDLAMDGYRLDPRLIEIDLGAWDGLTAQEAEARYPQAFAARVKDKWNVNVPGGENYASVAQRVTSFVADMQADTFAVSHGAATRILRGLFADMNWQQMSDLDEKQGVLFRVRGSAVERFEAK